MADRGQAAVAGSATANPELVRLMEAAVARQVFPGGVLLVQARGRIAHLSCHGRTSLEPPGGPVASGTCFDLASLTKVLATTSLVLLSIQRGALELDQPVQQVLDGYAGAGREAITVRTLLEHSSGLPAWRRYYEQVPAADLTTSAALASVRRRAAAEAPEAAPGTRVLYSDLGFILLDWVIERLHGRPSDALFSDWLARPLGLAHLFFVDLKSAARTAQARAGRVFAATEHCPWRGRTLSGEVHDENTYAVGGVSGQAGLFGTAEDVAALAQAWLDSFWKDDGMFRRDLVQGFWTKSGGTGATRALGFDTPSPQASQAGGGFGPRTVGHLGFTGTSLWIDPDRELIVVLLTNRVHPSRSNERIKRFRPVLHDQVAAIWPAE
jgi:serine-type D-Ala-D-Ala carboxypeptidase